MNFNIETFYDNIQYHSLNTYLPINKIQTGWYFEKSEGEYLNMLNDNKLTASERIELIAKYPEAQVFNQYELIKCLNSYKVVYSNNRIVIGPHFIIMGTHKSGKQFEDYGSYSIVNNNYFEETIAKIILFRAAILIHNNLPDNNGSMRSIVIPYTLSVFNLITKDKLNLQKIWSVQDISFQIKILLSEIIVFVEDFIKNNTLHGLPGEWAKKEECWSKLLNSKFSFDLNTLINDLLD